MVRSHKAVHVAWVLTVAVVAATHIQCLAVTIWMHPGHNKMKVQSAAVQHDTEHLPSIAWSEYIQRDFPPVKS